MPAVSKQSASLSSGGRTPSVPHRIAARHRPLQESQVRTGARAELGEGGLLPSRKLNIFVLRVCDGRHQGALAAAPLRGPLQESQVRTGARAELGEGGLLPSRKLNIFVLRVCDGRHQGALAAAPLRGTPAWRLAPVTGSVAHAVGASSSDTADFARMP
ncbi:hypothetical protein IOCL1545_000016400, partial [Leishmania shawi]